MRVYLEEVRGEGRRERERGRGIERDRKLPLQKNIGERERKQAEVNLPKCAEWVWVCLLKKQGRNLGSGARPQ